MAPSPKAFNVLVVGGNGFLGSAICKAFLAQGTASLNTARATVQNAPIDAPGSSSDASGPSSSARPIRVTSISPSGRPFVSPAGHRPAWSSSPQMRWERGDVFALASDSRSTGTHAGAEEARERLARLVEEADAVVHTVGILLESDYKPAGSSPSSSRHGRASSGSFGEIARGVLRGWGLGDTGNPLQSGAHPDPSGKGKGRMTYEAMNTQSALAVASAFADARRGLAAQAADALSAPPAFVYISASDLFRPFISSRYIGSKRAAEQGISGIAHDPAAGSALFRPIFMRPGLMYHPHTRPLSTLPAAALDLSSTLHAAVERHLPFLPTPAGVLRALSSGISSLASGTPLGSPSSAAIAAERGEAPSAAASLASLLTASPLHVDTVARAVVRATLDAHVPPGPKGIEEIKRLAGWRSHDARPAGHEQPLRAPQLNFGPSAQPKH